MIPVSSPYGTRTHPIHGDVRMHEGADLPVVVGTPVRAMWAGVVSRVDRDGIGKGEINGNAVHVRHANGYTSHYLHLSRVTVSAGQQLPQGFILGGSGSTGRSTGPHLHFAVSRGGVFVNPLLFYPPGTFAVS